MWAIAYKFKQLLSCKQVLKSCCHSSNGNITFLPRNLTNPNFLPNPVYDTYQKKIVEKKAATPIKKICSWNIQELWWHCYRGNKINNLIHYIVHSDASVFCLQEAFDMDIQRLIITHPKITEKYPYYITGNQYNSYFLGENSGLIVLSDQPILFRQFTPFLHTTVPDCFASKGALYLTIGEINFITTHLQSDNIRIALQQLAFIIFNSPFKEKTVLIGDLNIPDPFSPLHLERNNNNHTHISGVTLDHILPLFSDLSLSIDVDYINLKNTSDHWPLIASLNQIPSTE